MAKINRLHSWLAELQPSGFPRLYRDHFQLNCMNYLYVVVWTTRTRDLLYEEVFSVASSDGGNSGAFNNG